MKMKGLVSLIAAVLVVSGCICCGGGLPDLGGPDDGEDEDECPAPYMEYGSGCCLDSDRNGICDSDETGIVETTIPSPPSLPEESTTTTQGTSATETTQQDVTQATSPPTTLKATYNCVRNAGYNPDAFIYLYSRNCGSKYTDNAMTASSRKGVDVEVVDIDMLEEKEIKMMECFYGGYYEGNPTFGQCPMLLCPKTGEAKVLGQPVQSKMDGFALSCK